VQGLPGDGRDGAGTRKRPQHDPCIFGYFSTEEGVKRFKVKLTIPGNDFNAKSLKI
jgi:hypothetical protein